MQVTPIASDLIQVEITKSLDGLLSRGFALKRRLLSAIPKNTPQLVKAVEKLSGMVLSPEDSKIKEWAEESSKWLDEVKGIILLGSNFKGNAIVAARVVEERVVLTLQKLEKLIRQKNEVLTKIKVNLETIALRFELDALDIPNPILLKQLIERTILVKGYFWLRELQVRLSEQMKKEFAELVEIARNEEMNEHSSPESEKLKMNVKYLAAQEIKLLADKADNEITVLEPEFANPYDKFWTEVARLPLKEFSDLKAQEQAIAAINSAGITKEALEKFEPPYKLSKISIPPLSEVEIFQEKITDDKMSLGLVIAHTFIYMLNYYGFYSSFSSLPTTTPSLYSTLARPSTLPLLFSASPAVDTILQHYYGYLDTKDFSLVFMSSVFFLLIGNILYFVTGTIDHNAEASQGTLLLLLFFSRVFVGAAGVRASSQKYFTVMVNEKYQGRVNLLCGLTGNIGKMLGPVVGTFLTIKSKSSPGQTRDYFSVVFGILSLLLLFVFCAGFRSDKDALFKRLLRIKNINIREKVEFNQITKLGVQKLSQIAVETKKEVKNLQVEEKALKEQKNIENFEKELGVPDSVNEKLASISPVIIKTPVSRKVRFTSRNCFILQTNIRSGRRSMEELCSVLQRSSDLPIHRINLLEDLPRIILQREAFNERDIQVTWLHDSSLGSSIQHSYLH